MTRLKCTYNREIYRIVHCGEVQRVDKKTSQKTEHEWLLFAWNKEDIFSRNINIHNFYIIDCTERNKKVIRQLKSNVKELKLFIIK